MSSKSDSLKDMLSKLFSDKKTKDIGDVTDPALYSKDELSRNSGTDIPKGPDTYDEEGDFIKDFFSEEEIAYQKEREEAERLENEKLSTKLKKILDEYKENRAKQKEEEAKKEKFTDKLKRKLEEYKENCAKKKEEKSKEKKSDKDDIFKKKWFKITAIVLIVCILILGTVIVLNSTGVLNKNQNTPISFPTPEPTPVPTAIPTPVPIPTQAPDFTLINTSILTENLDIPGGDTFGTGYQPDGLNHLGTTAQWVTAYSKTIPTTSWNVTQYFITVTPASSMIYVNDIPVIPIVIPYPWKIDFTVGAKVNDNDPTSNAEFILYRYYNNSYTEEVAGFGWKGKYPSNVQQTTKTFEPGNYVMVLYVRGTGVKFDISYNKESVQIEDTTIREAGK